jgi:hypothetical protein
MGTSVGSSPFSINAAFLASAALLWFKISQSEKPHQVRMICHGNCRHFSFEAALTSCGILIVDCKTENCVVM